MLAPVIPPVTVPTVHAKELGTDATRLMLLLVPVHTFEIFGVVMVGLGFTVIVPVALTFPQPPVSGMV